MNGATTLALCLRRSPRWCWKACTATTSGPIHDATPDKSPGALNPRRSSRRDSRKDKCSGPSTQPLPVHSAQHEWKASGPLPAADPSRRIRFSRLIQALGPERLPLASAHDSRSS